MRCGCCDLPVESCGRAAEKAQRKEAAEEATRLLRSGWLPAQYPGRCTRCGESFPEGTPIKPDPHTIVSSAGRWVCCD